MKQAADALKAYRILHTCWYDNEGTHLQYVNV
jgi:hypothetical protein